jgi:hypothetical protein
VLRPRRSRPEPTHPFCLRPSTTAGWSKALSDWEFDDDGELPAKLDELIAAAPEAESDEDEDSEEDSDEDSD